MQKINSIIPTVLKDVKNEMEKQANGTFRQKQKKASTEMTTKP